MDKNHVKAITIVGILIFFYVFYLRRKYRKRQIHFPYKTTSMNVNRLIKYMPKRLDYIVNNSTMLDPYNKEKFNILANSIVDDTDLESIVLKCSILPNNDIGNVPILPLTDKLSTTTFQYGQGQIGWYFLYGTFLQKGLVANYFFYLLRVDTIPDELREKCELDYGEATYYNIVGGVGINGKWEYSPYCICRGEYKANTETIFEFTAIDLNEVRCNMQSTDNGQFHINMQWWDMGATCGFSASMYAVRPPFFNNPQGCTPCVEGAGTLYWSYTQMKVAAKLILQNKVLELNNGVGWMDRQWVNTNVNGRIGKIFANIEGMFNSKARGLGRYLWYNLHVNENLQYMITAFPQADVYPKQEIDCVVNEYGDDVSYNIGGKMRIEEVVDIKEQYGTTFFPTVISFVIRDIVYILDTRPFGVNLTIDISNNFHWTGSALLFANGKLIGTGFVEANQLQNFDVYTKNVLDKAKIDFSKKDAFVSKKLSFEQALPSIAITTLVVIAVCLIFIKKKKT